MHTGGYFIHNSTMHIYNFNNDKIETQHPPWSLTNRTLLVPVKSLQLMDCFTLLTIPLRSCHPEFYVDHSLAPLYDFAMINPKQPNGRFCWGLKFGLQKSQCIYSFVTCSFHSTLRTVMKNITFISWISLLYGIPLFECIIHYFLTLLWWASGYF